MISMVQKRPFVDEETYEVSCKYQRQLEYSNQLVSFLEFVPAEDTTQQPNFSGEGRGCIIKGDEKHTELLICTENDGKTSSPDSVSNTSFDSSSVSKEDNGSEVPFHLLFSHDHCNPDWPRRTLVHSEEIYTSLLECPPRKVVPVGPDFQADIPEWGTQGTNNVTGGSNGSEPLTHFPQASELDLSDHTDDETKLAGICVIPMPEFGPSVYNGDSVGDGRTDCCCRDSGSDRCVRQHIKESMDKNRSTSNSLKKLIYSTSAKESDNKSAAPEFSSSKPAVHQRGPKVPASPAKTIAPVLPKTATRKSTTDDSMDRKRATPRSLKELIYSSPDKESENKMTTPAATGRRIESSRVAPSPYKASKDCKTPLRTPIVAPANGISKHPSTTPCSEIRRNRTPLDPSASGSKTTGPKWHLLSAVCAKSLTA